VKSSIFQKDGKNYLFAFLLVSTLFFMWGVANNMTDTLLAAFKRIMSMSDLQSSLIQFAFYGAYFCFALPTALLIQKYSYKTGMILGLLLYSIGTMLFYPAGQIGSYGFYLIAIYIMAGGCSVLETTSNPYVMTMGSPETATRRLNIAQVFNPIGSLAGIIISGQFILAELSTAGVDDRQNMSQEALAALQQHELSAVTGTYMALGVILLIILVIMLVVKMPTGGDTSAKVSLKSTFGRLFRNKLYRNGVIAQFFYVGAQIGVWSFTIRLVMKELDVLEKEASFYFLYSMICFTIARSLFTYLMKYYQPAKLMTFSAICAIVSCAIVITSSGMTTVIALIAVSFFMSLMFPTIYGIALGNAGQDIKVGASGLIMAILGGAILTPLQGLMSDIYGINTSYIIPLLCFVAVMLYSIYASKVTRNTVK
jgi:FHS family L-fucose permease-like MFS transporter